MKSAASRILLTTLLAGLCAADARAQEAASTAGAWVTVAPAGESFVVSMPKRPTVSEQRLKLGGRDVRGRLYAVVGDDSASYRVWSLEDSWPSATASSPPPRHPALDELASELLALPVKDASKEGGDEVVSPPLMTRRGEIPGAHAGREYRLSLRARSGVVDIYSVGPRLYVVAADGPSGDDPRLARFLDSFGVKAAGARGAKTLHLRKDLHPAARPRVPSLLQQPESPVAVGPVVPLSAPPSVPPPRLGPGYGGLVDGFSRCRPPDPPSPSDKPTDYSRTFRASEVTCKAVITHKPEPQFTQGERKGMVTGVVRLRLVLSAEGKVDDITVISGLPRGLTEKVIEAARGIRFMPAEKDGRKVSQQVVIEYSINPY